MRFPAQEEKPQKVGVLAKVLGVTEKVAYKRIARVIKKCKTILDQEGVTIDELF
jgi:DNA-directed RNA polymerase specialized sigma24 family protein